jgi:hypothetical protein
VEYYVDLWTTIVTCTWHLTGHSLASFSKCFPYKIHPVAEKGWEFLTCDIWRHIQKSQALCLDQAYQVAQLADSRFLHIPIFGPNFATITFCLVSSVSKVTRYGLDGLGIESWWGQYFPHLSRPALGSTQPPIQWLPGLSGLTSTCHLSLSWVSSIQSLPPHSTYWRFTLILSSHLRLCLPSGLFPSGFPTKTMYNPLPSPIHTTCPAHLILLDFITCTIAGEEYSSLSFSLWSFLHFPVTSSLLGPNHMYDY